MNVVWYAVFLVSFIGLAAFALFYRTYVTSQSSDIRIEPAALLVVSYLLYSLSLPMSRLLYGSEPGEFDAELLRLHLYGFLGLALGSIISVPLTKSKPVKGPLPPPLGVMFRRRYSGASLRSKWFAAILGALSLRYLWRVFEALNFDPRNIFQSYGFEAAEGFTDSSLADTIVYYGLYSSLLLGIIWDRFVCPLSKGLIVYIRSLVVLLVVFWILRGSRNMVLLILLPTVSVYFYRKSINIFKAVIVGVLIISSLYIVGVLRNIGMNNVSRGDVANAVASIDPLYGELGTSYSVLDRAIGLGIAEQRVYGRGYLVDPFVNLVPRALWPQRPDNPAVAFSKRYFNTDQLAEGLGYSPVLEALLNVGELGIIAIFALISLPIFVWGSNSDHVSIRNIMLSAFMLPTIVNWNRIDLSTAAKMYSGFVFMAVVLPWILIRRRILSHP